MARGLLRRLMVCLREAEGWPYIAHASDRLNSFLSRQAKPRAQGGAGADWSLILFRTHVAHEPVLQRIRVSIRGSFVYLGFYSDRRGAKHRMQTSVGEALSHIEGHALVHVNSRVLLRCAEAGPLRLVRAQLFRSMNSFCLSGHGPADLSCQSTSHPPKGKISLLAYMVR